MPMALLEVEGLRAGYGAVHVLHGVDLFVDDGETAVILGLNGAGKTTTMFTIAGIIRPKAGRILYDGRPINRGEPRTLVRRGLVLVPEGRHVFAGLSVLNNLKLGAWVHRRDRKAVDRGIANAFEIFPRLDERKDQLGGTLSGGEQQMLAIARGLMADPRLLLVDEASLGLSPKLAQQVFQAMKRINAEGVTVLVVEQNAGILRLADRAFVMKQGRIVQTGTGHEVLEQGELRKAYLGAPS
jgi:branched-chain amino acid transport system ATP-binding protein